MDLLPALILIALGGISLFFGRRLFWLFAGIVGFALGWWLTSLLLPPDTSVLLRVIIAVVAGLILGALVRFLGGWGLRIVAAIAGFVILPMLLQSLGMLGGISESVWALVGAAVGFIGALLFVNWTLIFLSCILGAGLILEGVSLITTLSETARLIGGFVLIAVGAYVQSRQMQ
jgi:hypothetical protein